MKRFTVTIMLLLILCSADLMSGTFSLIQPDDSWTSFDKWQHFSFSLMLTVQSGYALSHNAWVHTDPDKKTLMYSAGFSLSLGMMKEIYDSRRKPNGLFSWKDLIYDIGGTACGVFILKAASS
jgi:uncharacterized protein YfiM (DUF2279 family)